MIRALLLLWLLPVGFFWTWYFLSLHDLSFGLFFFSRELHDLVFRIYGDILHVEPAVLPGMVAKALLLDAPVILGLVALKKRKQIVAFAKVWRGTASVGHSALASSSKESLSSAP